MYISIHEYILQVQAAVSLVLLNILLYLIILTNIFLIIFLHDTKFFKTLNELKNIYSNNIFLYIFVLAVLSMAGTPPLLGFFGKFFIVVFFFKQSQFILFVLFVTLNVFVIYFYLLNLRFLVTKTNKSAFFIKNYTVYYNFRIVAMLLLVTILNIFGIFFLNDLIFYVDVLCSFNF